MWKKREGYQAIFNLSNATQIHNITPDNKGSSKTIIEFEKDNEQICFEGSPRQCEQYLEYFAKKLIFPPKQITFYSSIHLLKLSPTEESGYNAATYFLLKKAKIRTIGKLCMCDAKKLQSIKGLGRIGLAEIRFQLARQGLKLKGD